MGRLDSSRIDERFRTPIAAGVVAASGLGVPGIFVPALDMGGIAVTWTTMLTAMAVRSGHPFSSKDITKLVVAAVSAVAGYKIGSKILTWAMVPFIVAFPVAGVPAAVVLNAGLNGLFTLRLGMACAGLFSRPDCTPQDALDFFKSIKSYLIKLPSREELALVKELLSSHSPETEPTATGQTRAA
jgi:hypothetical protein